MSSRRKDGGFPRKKHGNCNKPYRQAEREPGKEKDETGVPSSSRNMVGKNKHPTHLKGKDVGLWYARQNAGKPKSEVDRIPQIMLPSKTLEAIENLLCNVGSADNSDDNCIPDGVFKTEFYNKIKGTFEENLNKQLLENINPVKSVDIVLKNNLMKKISSSQNYQDILETRKKLPCFKVRKLLLDTISKNQVTVISGETGCGKTTQIAQYVMDDAISSERGSLCSIMCTQPRRISAISVAERVAFERDEPLGNSVGYQIRLERVIPEQKMGSILFVTTGILLQYMQSNPNLNGTSHLFLDEVHERDILCDLVTTCLKKIIQKRKDLKLILMSATVNAETFSSYFGDAPCIKIKGFTYPVEEIYLDKILHLTKFQYPEPKRRMRPEKKNNDFEHVIIPYVRQMEKMHQISKNVAVQLMNPLSEVLNVDLIEDVIRYICTYEKEGAILVFVPGLSEINKIMSQLKSRPFFNDSKFVIIPLHSTLPTINQKHIFSKAPRGGRKIIISTNIAETSITIDDVVFVVDSGFIKMTDFKDNLSMLNSQWISLSSGQQRRGRAGRVEAGKCYKLYTTARENLFEAYPLPEMQRARLDEVVLQIKMLQLGKAASFLNLVMDPPDNNAVILSLKMLKNLNAIDEDENLTPLGFHLAKLPLDPQTAKMILMAAIFGCIDPVFSIAAALSFKDPFMTPLGKEAVVNRIKMEFAGSEKSDHYLLSVAINKWENEYQRKLHHEFAYQHFLSNGTLFLLRDMKAQFAKHLHEMNFLNSANPKDETANVNSGNVELVKSIVCCGLYPNVAMIKMIRKRGRDESTVLMKTAEHPRVELHQRSVCSRIHYFESPFLVFHKMIKSSSIFIHDATMASPWALLFFGEAFDIVEFQNNHGIRVNNLIKFNCFKKTARLIQKLRSQLNWILAKAIANPGVIDWSKSTKQVVVLQAIISLLTAENEDITYCYDSE